MTKRFKMERYANIDGDDTMEDCDHGFLDGYSIDDRTFEGIEFKVSVDATGSATVSWSKNYDDYLEKFDHTWLKNEVIETVLADGYMQSNRENFDDDVILTEIA